MGNEEAAVIETFSEAGDRAFEKLNAPEPEPEKKAEVVESSEPKEPAKSEPPIVPPIDSGEAEKLAWMKSLDEKTLRDFREGKHVPKYRLDEVLSRVKLYESLGTPEELTTRLKVPPAALPAKTAEEPTGDLNDDDKAFQAYVLKMFPFLKDMPKTQEEFSKLSTEFQKTRESEHAARVADRNALIESAENKIKSLCEAEGLAVDGKNLKLHIGAITDILHDEENKAISDKFYNDRNVDVLAEVFKDYFNRFFSGFQRKAKVDLLKSKDNQEKLPKAQVKGGAAEVEVKKPLSKEAAIDAIATRWKASA